MVEAALGQLVQVQDPVSPALVERREEALTNPPTGRVAFYLNCIYYQFDPPAGRIAALSLRENPWHEKVTAPNGLQPDHADAEKVLGHLKLRFREVEMLDEAGRSC
jgi:hypothetical protein